MATSTKRTHTIELTDEELLLLTHLLASEAAMPDGISGTEQMQQDLERCREAHRLLDRLPSLYTPEDMTRLSYLALAELERLEAPRRASSWQHSALRRHLKSSLPTGIDWAQNG